MSAEEKMTEIQLQVLERIRPKEAEKNRLEGEFQKIKQQIKTILKQNKIKAEIELSGSFSRETWLSGNRDLDIFVKLPYKSEVTPNKLVEVIRKGIDLPWQRKHAHHPYLFTEKDDFEIEIIPCYQIEKGMKLRSAVDRSPLHRAFITQNIPIGSNDEVRLLKQFMRGIGIYGAEVKVHGFSGYLVELLIIHFGGKFTAVLKNAKTLPGKTITFFPDVNIDSSKYNGEPIIVIDPTDDTRNVASSVKIDALNEFIVAAENYLREPKIDYFFPKKIVINERHLKEMKESPIKLSMVIHKRKEKIVDDVLWGQIRRFERSIMNYLKQCEFEPIKIDSYMKGADIITAIVTKENIAPEFHWRIGPPIDHIAQVKFLEKHKNNPLVVYGPDVANGRWRVLLKQKQFTMEEIIKKGIQENSIAIPSHLQLSEKNIDIISKDEILLKYAKNKTLLACLYQLLIGRSSFVSG